MIPSQPHRARSTIQRLLRAIRSSFTLVSQRVRELYCLSVVTVSNRFLCRAARGRDGKQGREGEAHTMAVITPISREELLRARNAKQPGPRTLRRQSLDADAVAVIRAVNETGAAAIDALGEAPRRYVAGLRGALARAGKEEILVRRKGRTNRIIAWQMRPEDKVIQEQRRAWGAELAARFWGQRRKRERTRISGGRRKGRSSRTG